MLLPKPKITATGTIADFTPSTIRPENYGLALEFFASIYSRPLDAVLRELAANGVDAQQEAGYDGPVKITLPTLDSPFITVTDRGTGMTAEELTTTFSDYLSSTKRTSASAIGGFGVGSKTPFAVSDQFTVSSVKDGQRSLMIFAKLENGVTGHKIISTDATDAPNGTTVKVPVGLKNHEDWIRAAERVFYWWKPGSIEADGVKIRFHDDMVIDRFSTDTVRFSVDPERTQGFETTVRINGVGYNVPLTMVDDWFQYTNTESICIEADHAPLRISRSRETIDDTPEGREWLKRTLNTWRHDVKSRISNMIKEDEASSDQTVVEMIRTSIELFETMPDTFQLAIFHSINWRTLFYEKLRQKGEDFDHTLDLEFHYYKMPSCRMTDIPEEWIDVANSPLIYERELTSTVRKKLAPWKKLQKSPIDLVVVPNDITNLDEYIPPHEQKWVTGEEILSTVRNLHKNKKTALLLQNDDHCDKN